MLTVYIFRVSYIDFKIIFNDAGLPAEPCSLAYSQLDSCLFSQNFLSVKQIELGRRVTGT